MTWTAGWASKALEQPQLAWLQGHPTQPHDVGMLLRRGAAWHALPETSPSTPHPAPARDLQQGGQLVFSVLGKQGPKRRRYHAGGDRKAALERTLLGPVSHRPGFLISVATCFGKAEKAGSPRVSIKPSSRSSAVAPSHLDETGGSGFSWQGRRGAGVCGWRHGQWGAGSDLSK